MGGLVEVLIVFGMIIAGSILMALIYLYIYGQIECFLLGRADKKMIKEYLSRRLQLPETR